MLEDEINAVVEDLREALRWKESWAAEVGRCVPRLETLAKRHDLHEKARVDRLVANLRVGLYHAAVNPMTLMGYATGAINELAWLSSDLRRERESAA